MNSILYYITFASAVLIYGIGIDKLTMEVQSIKSLFIDSLKIFIIVLFSIIFVKPFFIFVLVPFSLMELFPFCAVLFYLAIAKLFQFLSSKTVKESLPDFSISFLIVLLSVIESSSFLESILIAISCILSFVLLQLILMALKKRFQFFRPAENFNNISLVYINIALFIIILCAWNVSWINPGVL